MFIQLINPTVDAYNIETGKFIGEARFTPTDKAEKALLDLINFGTPVKSLIMLDSNFQPSENYVPIIPNKTYHQKGIFRALLKEGDTGEWLPIEMKITYDWRTRSINPGNYFSSVEFSNIKMDGAAEIRY